MIVAKNLQHHISKIFVVFVTVLSYGTEVSKASQSVRPAVADNPETFAYEEGDTAVLYCNVVNLEDRTVTWRKLPSSSPLTIGTKSWIRDSRVHPEHVPNSSHWNLVIENVRVDDAGEYECQISRRKSHIRHKVTLVVKAKPVSLPPRIEISGENVLKAGNILILTCNASLVDVAVETIVWIKDGEPLLQGKDNRYSVHTSLTLSGQNSGTISSRLEIKDARADDSGVYLCRSTERIQMAGVKVEIQGTHTLKRADKKVVDESDEIYYPHHSEGGKRTSAAHRKESGLFYLAQAVVLVYTLFCFW